MVTSLVIVSLVSAFALSRVYLMTKPVIEKQRVEATQRALGEVLPGTSSFDEQEAGRLWYALDGAGTKVGIVFKVAPRGYAGPVETMVGVGLDGKVAGIRVASPAEGLKETPGLGLKAREPWFQDQFRGKTADELRLAKDGGALDAISAATITSRAVADGVSEGLVMYAAHLVPDAEEAEVGAADSTNSIEEPQP
jgi:electron transport complex protein RnfG